MVLFAEATEENMRIIKRCLNQFEAESGQKVNLQKSQMFFSRNVQSDTMARIAGTAGIEITNNLGRYLGVPPIHGRVSKPLYASMLDRLDKCLGGWKNQYLTLAGRAVLAKSSLCSIPYFSMQTTLLLAGLCDEIDRKIRGFIWGTNTHLIKWETITKAKSDGGLGIRKSREMNVAFFAKIAWRLNKDKESL